MDYLDPRYESPHYEAACRLQRLGAHDGVRFVLDRTYMPKPIMTSGNASLYTLADLDFQMFSLHTNKSRVTPKTLLVNPRVRLVNEPGQSNLVVVSEERYADVCAPPMGEYPLLMRLTSPTLSVDGPPGRAGVLRYRTAGADIDVSLDGIPVCRFPKKMVGQVSVDGLSPNAKRFADNARALVKVMSSKSVLTFKSWDEGILIVDYDHNGQPIKAFRSPTGPEPTEFWVDMATKAEAALMPSAETIPHCFCIVSDSDLEKSPSFCQPLRDRLDGYHLCDVSVISKAVSPVDASAGHSRLTKEQWSRPEARVVVLVPNEQDFMFIADTNGGEHRLTTATGSYMKLHAPPNSSNVGDIVLYKRQVAEGSRCPCYPNKSPDIDSTAVARLLAKSNIKQNDVADMLDFLAAATM